MPKAKDYYEVLGIKRDATTDQIRTAYRKLARQLHPDVNKSPDASKKFSEVQEAYDVLSEAEKRQSYDRFGHAGIGSAAGGTGPSGWSGFRTGAPGGQATWSNVGPGEGFAAEDLSDIFEGMFGRGRTGGGSPFGSGFGARPQARSAAQPGRDTDFPLTVSFMTAAFGGTEQIRFTVDGKPSTITVKIPAGIETGGKLRIKGRGQPGQSGGPPGDLILTVEVGKHPHFRRDGLDLLIDVPITIAEAVLGVTVKAPLLNRDGDTSNWVEIKVPPGTSSGTKLRVRGHGLTDSAGKTGDYHAIIQIKATAPKDLSEAGVTMVQSLAAELQNPRKSAPFSDN